MIRLLRGEETMTVLSRFLKIRKRNVTDRRTEKKQYITPLIQFVGKVLSIREKLKTTL